MGDGVRWGGFLGGVGWVALALHGRMGWGFIIGTGGGVLGFALIGWVSLRLAFRWWLGIRSLVMGGDFHSLRRP